MCTSTSVSSSCLARTLICKSGRCSTVLQRGGTLWNTWNTCPVPEQCGMMWNGTEWVCLDTTCHHLSAQNFGCKIKFDGSKPFQRFLALSNTFQYFPALPLTYAQLSVLQMLGPTKMWGACFIMLFLRCIDLCFCSISFTPFLPFLCFESGHLLDVGC